MPSSKKRTRPFLSLVDYTRQVTGARLEGINGLYQVSSKDSKNLRGTAYFVSSKTLASSMPPQKRSPPTYIQKGGSNVLSLARNFEGRKMWTIRRVAQLTRAVVSWCVSRRILVFRALGSTPFKLGVRASFRPANRRSKNGN